MLNHPVSNSDGHVTDTASFRLKTHEFATEDRISVERVRATEDACRTSDLMIGHDRRQSAISALLFYIIFQAEIRRTVGNGCAIDDSGAVSG